MGLLSKAAFLEAKKPETFSAAGPYKVKEQFLPGAKGQADSLINMIKLPVKKSPEDLAQVDPSDKMMQTLMLLQLLSGGHKPLIGPEAAGPLLAMQGMSGGKQAKEETPKHLAKLTGGGIDNYARNILKQLQPAHYDEAGGGSTEETVRNLVEDIIPRHILREHAARIGRGDVAMGQRLLEEHLSPSFHDTGETLPKALSRLLTGHVEGAREADKYKALLGVDIEQKTPAKKPGVQDWLSIIQQHAPKPEQDPFRMMQQPKADNAEKYGSVGSIPYQEDTLRAYMKLAVGEVGQGVFGGGMQAIGRGIRDQLVRPAAAGVGKVLQGIGPWAQKNPRAAGGIAAGGALAAYGIPAAASALFGGDGGTPEAAAEPAAAAGNSFFGQPFTAVAPNAQSHLFAQETARDALMRGYGFPGYDPSNEAQQQILHGLGFNPDMSKYTPDGLIDASQGLDQAGLMDMVAAHPILATALGGGALAAGGLGGYLLKRRSAKKREQELQQQLQQAQQPKVAFDVKRILKHPLTWAGGAAALPFLASNILPLLGAGAGAGLSLMDPTTMAAGGAGLLAHHYLGQKRAPDLSAQTVSPFYTPAEGGKARAVTMTPDLLRQAFTESPQVGALARAAGPDVLAQLPTAAQPGVMGILRRLLAKGSTSSGALNSAKQLLKHVTYATHGPASDADYGSREKMRQHLETITGQQGRRSGSTLADILRASAGSSGNQGALGSLSSGKSGLGDIKLTDDFGDQLRQTVLQRLAAGSPMTTARA